MKYKHRPCRRALVTENNYLFILRIEMPYTRIGTFTMCARI